MLVMTGFGGSTPVSLRNTDGLASDMNTFPRLCRVGSGVLVASTRAANHVGVPRAQHSSLGVQKLLQICTASSLLPGQLIITTKMLWVSSVLGCWTPKTSRSPPPQCKQPRSPNSFWTSRTSWLWIWSVCGCPALP